MERFQTLVPGIYVVYEQNILCVEWPDLAGRECVHVSPGKCKCK